MTKDIPNSGDVGKKPDRRGRAVERARRAQARREAALRLTQPASSLPPRPEGLGLPVIPALVGLVGLGLLFWHFYYGVAVIVSVIAYAYFTRNDLKRRLLDAYLRGRMQFAAGDYEAALANFSDIEDADFSPPAVLRAIALTHYQLGNWAEAATYLEDVPKRTPDEDAILAHCLVELDETEEAGKVLGAMESTTPLAGVVRGVMALRSGDAEHAVRVLQDTLAFADAGSSRAEEPFIGATYWLGVARAEAGDEDGAREEFEAVYSVNPGYHDVAARLGKPGPGDAE